KVRKRNTKRFDRINYKLMHNQQITPAEEQLFIQEMINSDNLYSYIADHGQEYDYFIFIPYMFGTTYYGSKIYPEKSFLIPCLHDESYAYMSIYKDMFENAAGTIFLSEPEKELANKLFNLSAKQMVSGGGIETDIAFDSKRFREKYSITDKFILYAGRRELGKNVPLLIDYFCKYKENNDRNLKLILIGSGVVEIPRKYKTEIIDLGFIPKQDKYDAYAAATILCQPSVNESFSIVIMESWLCGTPVLVHADCAVTKYHCIQSNGGLYFSNYEAFEECIKFYIANPELSNKMAENGKTYVKDNYNWDKIVDMYKAFFEGD
ncbi:glycosyltransferase family 4 protein, partial [candidate division WOR-3 bacterium]|nr:glycosyltransferase family 4 protein [candidate division WOR-3 bacterium]